MSYWFKTITSFLLIVGLLFIIAPYRANATSIAFFNTFQNFGGTGTQTTNTFDLTGAGTHVTIALFTNSGDATHDIHATDCTWNGVSMAQVGTTGTGGINGTGTMWVLANANVGNFNLVCNWNGSITPYGAGKIMAVYNGTSDTQPDAFTSASLQGSQNFTINVTTVADNSWIVLLSNAGAFSAGANTTLRENSVGFIGDTNAAQTPAGVHSVAENAVPGANQTVAGAMSIAPFNSGGANAGHANVILKKGVIVFKKGLFILK